MTGILRILRCAIVLLIADSTMVNFSVLTRAMSTIAKSFEAHQVVPDVVPKAPIGVAHVKYPSGAIVDLGNVLTPRQVSDTPSVTWDAEPNKFFTLLMTDLDVTSRTEPPKVHQLQHWLVTNVPSANVSAGDVLYDYIGSGPPPGSGLHRYVFLVYKQPGKLAFDDPVLTSDSLETRSNISIEKLVKKYNLGEPIAGNYYRAEYDDYVPVLYKRLQEKYKL